jgi:predicted alpha/beta hydrolase
MIANTPLPPVSALYGFGQNAKDEEIPSTVCATRAQLHCADGVALAATWYEPQGRVNAVAVINPATGVRRAYYRAFAEWLARRGYAVLTYDYRGIGDSLSGPVRQSPATMLDWARQDIPAALRAAQTRALPLLIVGHSSGGNLLALADGHERAAAIVVIGSQLAGADYWPGRLRAGITGFFHLVGLVAATQGYLPAWFLGGGNAAPLPHGVAQQWSRWGRTEGYYFGAEDTTGLHRAEAYCGPYHAYSISDDIYAPPRAVEALVARHSRSQSHIFRVVPADLGLKAIGHFGPFRREVGRSLWLDLLTRIEAAAPELRAGQATTVGHA